MEKKSRKGYSSQEKQTEANRRYLANNPETRERKKISNLKSNGKKYIKEFAQLSDLEEFKEFIKEREKILKK
ncbi:MAG: hypothetical protein SOY60_10130 [Fusobacterium gastrosuis]|uniref:hypothetical protein n=1 Tax=Fusobacterium gastrosuis TaxID=1755100 RepID=UPI002A85FF56|nr:hypothetical protein [Fusobacterium gastrosuis]